MTIWMPCRPTRLWVLFAVALLPLAEPEPAGADTRGVSRPHQGKIHSSAKTDVNRPKLRHTARTDRVLLSADTVEALEQAITKLETIVAGGGWPRLAEGPPLRKGQMDDRLSSLVHRLRLVEDLPDDMPAPETVDDRIESAVARFQHRHGLPATAVVDERTRAAMNVSASVRLRQTRVNLQRLRALVAGNVAQNSSKAQVVVNVPAFEMQAIANDQIAVSSRVVVGKPDTPTPTLAVKLTALNFFPYWHVPQSILIDDVIPKFRRDPGYLKKTKIRVYRRWREVDPKTIDWTETQIQRHVFRQEPGRSNVLGFVRFDMPNRHTVYMHDSPARLLFRFSNRARSAGCVRVEKARELTKWLLRDEADWNEARLGNIISQQQREKARLSKPVTVRFIYLTAWPGQDGRLHFREDIYGQDDLGLEVANYGGLSEPMRAWNASNERPKR